MLIPVILLALGLGAQAGPQLRFQRDGTFKVVMFTDLHYGESPQLDEGSGRVQATVLGAERPQLVVFSGDMVSGYGCVGRPGWYAEQWAQVTAPARAAGTPWGAILGNHDGEADLERRQIVANDILTGGSGGANNGSSLSLTQQGPPSAAGASNYFLDIYDPEGSAVAARIWMLDSNNRGCGARTRAGWGCVAPSALAWVRRTAEGLPTVPSLAFIHIPVPQFMEAWASRPTNGSKGEPTGCPMADTRAFDVLRDVGIRAIYSGHDHYNDYAGKLQGVRLAYGRKSGYGGYGPKAGMQRGARVILLRRGETPSASETWIRQEDGSRLDQAPTPPEAKLDTLQHTCISDGGLLGWVGWSTRTARLTTGGVTAGLALAAALAGFVAVRGGRRRWAGRPRVERELSASVSRASSTADSVDLERRGLLSAHSMTGREGPGASSSEVEGGADRV